jgi:ribosomal protein S18 acetylase RimI-like enzyme
LLASLAGAARMISRATRVDAELVAAFARLIPQLSKSPPPDATALAAILAQPDMHVLVARDHDAIAGVAFLLVYRIATGTHARIDDVVVDTTARGRGVGEALTREAIQIAREANAKAIHLTSHPSREAANRLYQRLGFERRDSNIYRLALS